MVNVCTEYCGAVILLAEFETNEEAEEFMKHKYVLFEADETEDRTAEVINPEEMLIEEEIPFAEPVKPNEYPDLYELPF